MNLFQKYGIKEVADVVFYSITEVGDEEFYTPVLFLDTLKVSTIEKSAEKVTANGGKGNKKLLTWNFGKEVTLNFEDALFSPASMSLIWGGNFQAKLSDITSAIVKLNMAKKYYDLNYSIKAYPSPTLTDRELDIIYEAIQLKDDTSKIEFIKDYYSRENLIIYINGSSSYNILNRCVESLVEKVQTLNDLGYMKTQISDIEVIDRMEKCIVKNREGLIIDTNKQKENLMRYYANDKTSSYTIFYDVKTMLPLVNLKDGYIYGWSEEQQANKEDSNFRIKMGTIYYKWTRTVKYKEDSFSNGILGKSFEINAETFPEAYKIVGETYIRNQKTGKDERFQFIIHRANVNSDTSITLEAEGDPTTFSMQIDVLTPKNNIMMELRQFDVEEDKWEGGTRIVPRKGTYSYTPGLSVEKEEIKINDNKEIY